MRCSWQRGGTSLFYRIAYRRIGAHAINRGRGKTRTRVATPGRLSHCLWNSDITFTKQRETTNALAITNNATASPTHSLWRAPLPPRALMASWPDPSPAQRCLSDADLMPDPSRAEALLLVVRAFLVLLSRRLTTDGPLFTKPIHGLVILAAWLPT